MRRTARPTWFLLALAGAGLTVGIAARRAAALDCPSGPSFQLERIDTLVDGRPDPSATILSGFVLALYGRPDGRLGLEVAGMNFLYKEEFHAQKR